MTTNQQQKFIDAVNIIHQQLDKPINLNQLANQLNLSLSSLKRLFKEAVNQSPGQFIQRLRLEYAFKSLHGNNQSVIDTVIESGYENHSAFSRRFKAFFQISPSEASEKNMLEHLHHHKLQQPELCQIEAIKLQAYTVTGTYFSAAPKAWSLLENALQEQHLLQDDFTGLYIGIGHDNPHHDNVKENEVRFSACCAFQSSLTDSQPFELSAGYYARFQYHGKLNNMGLAYHYIYGQWPVEFNQQIDQHKPSFRIHPQLPEGLKEQTVYIYVPLI